MTDQERKKLELLCVPLDEISIKELEQLKQFAEEHDWQAMRDQLVHYSKRYQGKGKDKKS